jgi:hypothetical protein
MRKDERGKKKREEGEMEDE